MSGTSRHSRTKRQERDASALPCAHEDVAYIPARDVVRKFRCQDCKEVLTCACDEDVGRRLFPEQVEWTTEFSTHQRVKVTRPFAQRVCERCRGLPAIPHPLAEIFGRTSKIKRYYWREIEIFEREWLVAEASKRGFEDTDAFLRKCPECSAQASDHALAAAKALHASTPIFTMAEESDDALLKRLHIPVEKLEATYVKVEGERARVLLNGVPVSVEEFATAHYEALGYEVIQLESAPFHVLFGLFMFLVVQDPTDPLNRVSIIGNRDDFENRSPTSREIWFLLPSDFGCNGYAERRAKQIDAHLDDLENGPDIEWLFDYWMSHSESLRQYLWAHRASDIARARRLFDLLDRTTFIKVLRFLVADYWGHYLGWPDLLLHRNGEIVLVEVKSSSDKLTQDQKEWIEANARELGFTFKIAKVHRQT